MATKWKNTAISKFFQKLCSCDRLLVPAGAFFGILAFLIFYNMLSERYNLNTIETWRYGIVGNILLILACCSELNAYLNRTLGSRVRHSQYTYQDWKRSTALQQKILLPVTGFLLLISISSLVNLWDSRHDYYGYYVSVTNYASAYVLIFTTLAFFITCECVLIPYMRRLLDGIMDKANETNRQAVNAAIEAEKKSIEDSIRSEQLKVDLISNVSHDLKTPLTSMVGYIDLMKKEEMSDLMADYVEVLSNKAQKLKEMIESLFSLAKTSSGNIELHPEPLNLNRLVEQIYADMEDRIAASRLTFVTELTAADTELVTDSAYLYRICQNLIENALKYSAANTRVFLKTYSALTEQERVVRFEITNTAGYPMDFTKEQIVERFARGDESRTSEGNGLGLAIVSTYTSALGGRFDVLIDCDQFKAVVEFSQPQ